MADRKQRLTLVQEMLDEATKEPELNLAPIMNLFVILIPFLLLSASFVKYTVIETPAPRSQSSAASKKKSPTVMLTVTKKRWTLAVFSPWGKLRKTSYKKGDYAGLYKRLKRVKKKYPDHETVVIKSVRGVAYREIIEMIDVVRGDLPSGLGLDELTLKSSSVKRLKSKTGKALKAPEKTKLFSEVVFGDVF